MIKHVVGSKILKKEQVLISILLIAILVLSSGSMVAFAKSNTYIVKPSGDTSGATDAAAIQAALNMCTKGGPQCTVQLLAGTYYINSQINVYGFQGSFVGAGQGQTTIEVPPTVTLPPEAAIYNTPSATAPYWATPPSASNPWPNIFTFVGGSISISGMTIEDLNPSPVTSYWCYSCGGGYVTNLWIAIQITGQPSPASPIPQVSATINQVQVVGTSLPAATYPPTSWSISNGIIYGGQFLPSVPPTGWTNTNIWTDIFPISGTFSVTNSMFNTVQTGAWAWFTTGAMVAFRSNTLVDNLVPLGSQDLSKSVVTITGNHMTNIPYDIGVFAIGSDVKPPCTASVTSDCLLPSTVYVTDNYFQTNWGGSGVIIADFGTPSTLSAVVTGNTVVTDTSCGCYAPGYPAIGAVYADVSPTSSSLLVSMNTILGGGGGIALEAGPNSVVIGNQITGTMAGVVLGCYTVPSDCSAVWGLTSSATGVHVVGNVIKNSAQYGIWVGADSSNNKITGNFITGTTSGGYDLYYDGTGTGNVWFGNLCGDHTSSPPGLC